MKDRTLLEQAERAARRGQPIAENLRTQRYNRAVLDSELSTSDGELLAELRDGRAEEDMFSVWSDV